MNRSRPLTLLTSSILLLAASAGAQVREPQRGACDRSALTILRGIIIASHGAAVVREAQFSVENTVIQGNRAAVDVLAFGLNGDDSDTNLEYRLVFELSSISKSCGNLVALKRTGEN